LPIGERTFRGLKPFVYWLLTPFLSHPFPKRSLIANDRSSLFGGDALLIERKSTSIIEGT